MQEWLEEHLPTSIEVEDQIELWLHRQCCRECLFTEQPQTTLLPAQLALCSLITWPDAAANSNL